MAFPLSGSSPLTRGKLGRNRDGRVISRLIPAHAGKTLSRLARRPPLTAHPRSRGENRTGGKNPVVETGSSPLTRGKRDLETLARMARGLIPAHAGKTAHLVLAVFARAAHPRSRGENLRTRVGDPLPWGSSPLTRGKRLSVCWLNANSRLIPAHAGKTTRLYHR